MGRFFTLMILVILGLVGLMGWTWQEQRTKETQFDDIIQAVAQEIGIDPLLVRAVISRESRFNPRAMGEAQERGLMQITPVAAGEWAAAQKVKNFQVEDLFQPRTNILVGSWLLHRALKRWAQKDDAVPFALAEYNAGRGNALRWVDPDFPESSGRFRARIDFPTTRAYVTTIMAKREEYANGYIKPPWEALWERIARRLASRSNS